MRNDGSTDRIERNINRITVEFKLGVIRLLMKYAVFILIESQWNLNMILIKTNTKLGYILIESQWNLNSSMFNDGSSTLCILIESQWNLNMYTTVGVTNITHINRITVEFKYAILAYITVSATILIESQWNLNSVVVDVSASGAFILIESQWNLNEAWMVCMIIEGCILIESQWNLKIEARFFLVDTLSYYSGSVVKTKSNIFIMN